MKSIRWPAWVFCMVLLFSACATTPQRPRIGDLVVDDARPIEQPAIDFEIDREQVINSYRQLAQNSPDQPPFDRIRQRLADLELESSLDNRLSADAAVAAIGATQAREAITRYQAYLARYPDRDDNDRVLYQLARAYAIDDDMPRARQYMDRLVEQFPNSRYIDEVQFRRGEMLFVEGDFRNSARAYSAVTDIGESSQYFDKALYKKGWAQFKLLELDAALGSFIGLLDLQQRDHRLGPEGLSPDLARADREFIEDVLRVVSLAFSYSRDKAPIDQYFRRSGHRVYEPVLYRQLANHYLEKDRITDAADTLLAYAVAHPDSPYTARFHDEVIAIYQRVGYDALLLREKTAFVDRYAVGSDYWRQQTLADQHDLSGWLLRHLADLATHYHALARKNPQSDAYQKAVHRYRQYITDFPDDERTPEMNFLLAECLFESGRYGEAIVEYQRTAYEHGNHARAAEAGYAVLSAYDRHMATIEEPARKSELLQARADSALRFSERFATDSRAPAVLLYTSEQYYEQKNYARASELAARMVDDPKTTQINRLRALTISAYSYFELKDFVAAESAYQSLLQALPTKEMQKRQDISQQLATTVYMQAAALRDQGQSLAAAKQFERIANIAPDSTITQTARYDAATEYIKLEQWSTAISRLQAFRSRYPQAPDYARGVSEKLALAYLKTDQKALAGAEILTIMGLSAEAEQPDLLWQAANLYDEAGEHNKAIDLYKRFVRNNTRPFERVIETQSKIADFYATHDDPKKRRYWLRQIVKSDASAGNERSDRSRLLAARASLELVQPTHRQFSRLRLTIPLKTSLKRKKQLMQESLDAYTRAARYQIEEITTQATYNIGEIYREFARSLLKSEKPKGLNEEELEEYNFLLEDQAFPFEEKAITIHESNLARIATGSFDESIRKSLDSLSEMMPFRYAKSEVVDSHVE
jgi:TolA-binding protein